jgi:hypothetical protein
MATDTEYWTDIYNNLKAAYNALTIQHVEEVTVDGKTWRYVDRIALRSELIFAGKRAGLIKPGTKVYAVFK